MGIYSDLINSNFHCPCMREHNVYIKEIDLNFDFKHIGNVCNKYFINKKIAVLADKNTRVIQADEIVVHLRKDGFEVDLLVLNDEEVIPDEKIVGTILMRIGRDISGIVAVGSGTINDLARFIASRIHIPYISVPTAPSMDGYASVVSPLILNNKKITFPAISPFAIIGDINIIGNAPLEMIQAGFGDIIGKKTAISDWILSAKLNNEYYCDYTSKIVQKATKLCIENVDKIYNRNPKGIKYLMDALILSGVSISMIGYSRPASGAEHLIAHYLEIKYLKEGKNSILHGTSVALGTLLVSMLYEYVLQSKEFLKVGNSEKIVESLTPYLPKPMEVKEWLQKIGLSIYPKDYGISFDLLKETLLNARLIRDRFTILSYAEELNILEAATTSILTGLY
jgi:glycerol-1-phosphate dehydrogenase [NAD(P)+]